MLLRTVCSISLLLLIMGFIIENNLKNLPHYKRSEFYLNISVANTHNVNLQICRTNTELELQKWTTSQYKQYGIAKY